VTDVAAAQRPDVARWRAELLAVVGPHATPRQRVLIEVAIGAREHLRALAVLAAVASVHDLDVRCRRCGAYPRTLGDACPGPPMLATVTARSVVQLARALRMLGVDRRTVAALDLGRQRRRHTVH